jgi:hypothetical protein
MSVMKPEWNDRGLFQVLLHYLPGGTEENHSRDSGGIY